MLEIEILERMILFIQDAIARDITPAKFRLIIVAISWLLVGAAMILDFFSGVRKAKERGELRTSEGFRMSVRKVSQYYMFLAFAFLLDFFLMLILSVIGFEEIRNLPFISIGASVFLIFIEWRSFMEKASVKTKRQFKEGLSEIITLLENRDDLIDGIKEIIKEKSKSNEQRIEE